MTSLPADPLDQGGIAAFALALRRGETTAEATTRTYLARIDALNPRLQAYQHVDAERAIAAARAIDGLLASGTDLGPLMGVPIGIKDIIAVDGMPTTNGSLLDTAHITGPEGAMVQRLKSAGVVILGKTKTVEYAFGATGVNSVRGTPCNPWDSAVHRTPGGSSSGSGVATAAGLAAFTIGTDTGGSVRIPATLNGIFGHKTTVGMWPTDGVFPLSPTLDSIGPLCRTAADAAIVHSVMNEVEIPLPGRLKGLRLGRPTAHFYDNLDDQVAACMAAAEAALVDAGVELVDVDLPGIEERVWLFRSIVPAEMIASLGRELFEAEQDRMDPVSAARAAVGLTVDAVTHVAAQRRLETLMWEAAEAFGDLDGWISPTCPCLPMPISEVTDAAHLKQAMLPSQNTQAANLYGICAISTPIHHFGANLPVGLQVMCPAGYDSEALAIGMAMETTFGPAPKPDLDAFLG